MRWMLAALVLGASSHYAGVARADDLALKDGRFINDRKIERTEGAYKVHFQHGEIVVKADLVVDYFQIDDAGTFAPSTPEEKEKVDKGLLPWNGQWMTKDRRERLREKERVARAMHFEQQQKRRKWRDRATVKTKNFTFEHTLPDDLFEGFKDLFETYFEVFRKEWKIHPSKEFGKVTINIYHDQEYYEQVSGAPRGVVGYYVPAQRDLHFFYDRDRHDFTVDVMFHEGNHMLTHMINEKVWYPAWLGEGMAEYYGASDWDPATKTMTVGGIQSARLCVLWSQVEETKKWQELKALIETPRVSAIQYAWAWSFCHFLLNTPKYEKAFKKFFVAIGKDKKMRRVAYGPFVTVPPEEQIDWLMKALKVKHLEEVQAEWHEYIKTKLALDKVKLDWAGAGWIMSLYGERQKAKEFFEKAVKESAQSGYVYYSYAKLLYDDGKTEEASEYAYKATDVDPLHARAWLLKGLCHVRKDKLDEGKRLIELAMEIDPDDERIWLEKAWLEEREQEAGR